MWSDEHGRLEASTQTAAMEALGGGDGLNRFYGQKNGLGGDLTICN
jgi:hypothetical protein